MQNPLQKNVSNPEIMRYISLFTQVGLSVVSALLICFFGFLYLDRLLHTNGVLMIVGTILGVAAGMYAGYRQISRFFRDKDIDKRSNV
ncbi:MAG: AtpZ/AtpI family protein [Candidatus Cloacimonetes bacterium]|nr:AtpZ/AtpI family protein [Candidatus Cloacimonadota bacterium]